MIDSVDLVKIGVNNPYWQFRKESCSRLPFICVSSISAQSRYSNLLTADVAEVTLVLIEMSLPKVCMNFIAYSTIGVDCASSALF